MEADLRMRIAELFAKVPCMPIMVRLAWHDSGSYCAKTNTGGANATIRFAPEAEYAANNGLGKARDWLEPIKAAVPEVSYADLYQLASVVAIEFSGGPKIPFRFGRKDLPADQCSPDGRLPDADKKMPHLRDIFYRMGFNDKEIIVLSGAHCLGSAHKDRSGFEGPWTEEPLKFDNSYYTEILKADPNPKLLRLISDMALLDDPEHKKLCELYASDQDAFFNDYVPAHQKLSELAMWRLHDAIRQTRRLSNLEYLDSLQASHLRREREPPFRPIANQEKYSSVGGNTGRLMLVNWLCSEATSLSLNASTLCLSVAYLERLLDCMRIPLCAAQEYAAACLLVAIKMEEVGGDAMDIADEVDVAVGIDLEVFVLHTLEWKLVAPTLHTFLAMYAERFWLPYPARNAACAYLKHMLLYPESQSFYPSSLALVCILLLERDEQLPAACKELALGAVRDGKGRAEEVAEAFRCFRHKCPSSNAAPSDESSSSSVEMSSCGSSTTAYPCSMPTSEDSNRSLFMEF